jgi:Glycosyl transferase family 2
MSTPTGCAPIALFAYMRPEHLRLTVESLRANAEAKASHLTVFCDAAKKPEHQDGVDAVRAFADTIDGFASVTVVRRERNLGLAASIIDGVTRLTEAHGRVIVVEDDLLLSRHFLRYMNDALDLYADDARVASVHGYCYPVGRALPETFFLRGADCWGWATWQRAWRHFRPDGAALLAELESRGLTHEFDYDGRYGFTRMLRDQIAGRNDSWAIRWHASCYLAGLLTLYPGRSLVHNIGNDASGTHCDERTDYAQTVAAEPVPVRAQPVEVSTSARDAFVAFFRAGRPSPVTRVARALRRVLKVGA